MYLTGSKFNTCVIHTEDYLIFSVNSPLIKKFYLDKYFENLEWIMETFTRTERSSGDGIKYFGSSTRVKKKKVGNHHKHWFPQLKNVKNTKGPNTDLGH